MVRLETVGAVRSRKVGHCKEYRVNTLIFRSDQPRSVQPSVNPTSGQTSGPSGQTQNLNTTKQTTYEKSARTEKILGEEYKNKSIKIMPIFKPDAVIDDWLTRLSIKYKPSRDGNSLSELIKLGKSLVESAFAAVGRYINKSGKKINSLAYVLVTAKNILKNNSSSGLSVGAAAPELSEIKPDSPVHLTPTYFDPTCGHCCRGYRFDQMDQLIYCHCARF